MTREDRQPLTRVRRGDVAGRVLLVGDPARAEAAAGLLDGAGRVAANREYETYTGTLRGRRITVASHGVGAAGAGICFEELIRAGARVLLRAGTCGALRDDLADGDLVLVTAAARDDGLSAHLAPPGFPAAADPDLVLALRRACAAAGRPAREGLTVSTDLFYPAAYPQDFDLWRRCGVLAIEMEAAPLFVLAALRGARAGALLTVDGHPARAAADMSEYDPYREVVRAGSDAMLAAALEALSRPLSGPRHRACLAGRSC